VLFAVKMVWVVWVHKAMVAVSSRGGRGIKN